MTKIDNLCINTIRMLGVDAINEANSGHPGIVLGAAPMAHVLYTRHLNINSEVSNWINRDRFILSAGHGSMLLYALNHLSGYEITMQAIKNFRNPGSTAGHPEYNLSHGIEATTGPLGQGIANGVGMAIAQSFLANKFNKMNHEVFNHYVYCLCGDGDLQEGIAQEAISLAGHLGLEKLIILYDSNDIQLDGPTSFSVSENHKMRFESVGWNYDIVANGNNIDRIDKAIKKAKLSNKPTIIEIKTKIGFGSPLAGLSKAHGAPIGLEARKQTAINLDYKNDPFEVEKEVYDYYDEKTIQRGKKAYNKWTRMMNSYEVNFKEEYALLDEFLNKRKKIELKDLPKYDKNKEIPTRNASGDVILTLSEKLPYLVGGSADLSSSTKAKGLDGHFSKDNKAGRNINYGVREHAMGAITNGIILHGVLKAFAGGFLVFSDYMKPAIRLSALMDIPVTYIFTHDTIMVGEDGPTHQPVEQLVMLRSIPNMVVLRPADANETVQAWHYAINNPGPKALILTRQNVTNLSEFDENFNKGAYVFALEKGILSGILLASGSEVSLAVKVKEELEKQKIHTRVISMPSMELFNKQPIEYQKEILPDNVKILAIEMASPMPWYKYTKHVYGINSFGISAEASLVRTYFNFNVQDIVNKFKTI